MILDGYHRFVTTLFQDKFVLDLNFKNMYIFCFLLSFFDLGVNPCGLLMMELDFHDNFLTNQDSPDPYNLIISTTIK